MNPLKHSNRLLRSLAWTALLLVLINLFNALFLYQRTTSEVIVELEMQSDYDTWVWMAHRSLEQDSVYRTDRIELPANTTIAHRFRIPPSFRLDNVSLFWNYSEQGTLNLGPITVEGSRRTRQFPNAAELVTYASYNVRMNQLPSGLELTAEQAGNGWIMMDTDKIMDLSKAKNFRPFSWWINLLLALALFYLVYKADTSTWRLMPELKGSSWLQWRVVVLRLWILVLPFWLISSHTFLAASLLLLILHLSLGEMRLSRAALTPAKWIASVFLAMVLSDLLFHPSSLTDTLSRYLYFPLTPLVFIGVPATYFRTFFLTAAAAVSAYLAMVLLGAVELWIGFGGKVGIAAVMREIVEVRWHTSYLSACLLIPLLISYKYVSRKGLYGIWVVFVLCLLLLIGARLPMLLGAALFGIIVIVQMASLRLKRIAIGAIALTILGAVVVFSVNDSARSMIAKNLFETETQKSDARFTLWQSAAEAISEAPWTGYGRGQIPETLAMYIPEQSDIRFRRYNAHNQYLEFALGYGLTVLLLFLLTLFVPALRRDSSYIVFAIYFSIAMMVETYFTRQSGVVLFAFWYALLIMKKNE